MLTDGTGKGPGHVVSKAVLKNKDQDVRETTRQEQREREREGNCMPLVIGRDYIMF